MLNIIACVLTLLPLFQPAVSRSFDPKPQKMFEVKSGELLQPNITWDEHSLFVNGDRILVYSGEFHPFRLPVPTLWLDVLQKIRSLGYTAVSFYVDWALVEGKPGEVRLDGVFALEPFFKAAQQAGIYLIARPGPYINAEVSGGGFPGWLQRIKGHVRTADQDYLDATELYIKTVCEVIAKAQITEGGPVILVQPENEYSHWAQGFNNDPEYFNYVEKQFRDAGIVVPLITNDAGPDGNNVPGSAAAFDIYGHDLYPLGFDCSHPDAWPEGRFPTNLAKLHQEQSPSTPYTIPEFQGGSFDPWGGPGFDKCLSLVNAEFERVFWKNLYSFGVKIYNVYMIYGGTNWGNMGHPNGYTSYDYGAVISEDRLVSREKYSEAKLQANFLAASPAYLTAIPSSPQAGAFVTTRDLTVTKLQSNDTQFLVVRHTNYNSKDATSYQLLLKNTKIGDLKVPQTNESLVLNGRDSKIHVVNYDLFGHTLLYSTAEILTTKTYGSEVVLVVFSGPGEQHELAVDIVANTTSVRGSAPETIGKGDHTIFSWKTDSEDRAIGIGPLTIWFVDRQSAYNFWVLDIPSSNHGDVPYAGQGQASAIIKGGYLMRTAHIDGATLMITGDINETTTIEVIAGAPDSLNALIFNDKYAENWHQAFGVVTSTIQYEVPDVVIPDLSTQQWYYLDSLPEIHGSYSDHRWTQADLKSTNNSIRNLTTPTSLYSSDYGFHAGTLVYRGHFNATGTEQNFTIEAKGGQAFGFSAWVNSHFLGSFIGDRDAQSKQLSFTLPTLARGENVFTIVIDNMGYDENWIVGEDWAKNPRGILDYTLDGHRTEDVSWKVTGNLGGENYFDKVRGPLNEGGMWAERHGYHLPSRPDSGIPSAFREADRGPMDGISEPGIAFYSTYFDLNLPKGYDIPLAIQLPDIRAPSSIDENKTSGAYRAQIWVNGWQFGEYVSQLGPQTLYPVPVGILDYHGSNFVAISLWAMEEGGARIEEIKLVAGPVIQTSYPSVERIGAPFWEARSGVY